MMSWTYYVKLLHFILKQLIGPLFSHINCIKTSTFLFFLSFCLSFVMENFQHIQNEK